VKIEVARAEAVAAVGRDRGAVRQLPVLEAVDLERARVLGLAAGSGIATRHQDGGVIGRRHTDLMAVNAAVE